MILPGSASGPFFVSSRYAKELLLDLVHFLFGQVFKIDQAVARLLRHAQQLVDLQLQRLGISILRRLNKKNHQKCDDGGSGIDHQLLLGRFEASHPQQVFLGVRMNRSAQLLPSGARTKAG